MLKLVINSDPSAIPVEQFPESIGDAEYEVEDCVLGGGGEDDEPLESRGGSGYDSR
eukprot:SAG11_NODE_5251_length_1615_cov_1.875989_1_plen_56_part_00